MILKATALCIFSLLYIENASSYNFTERYNFTRGVINMHGCPEYGDVSHGTSTLTETRNGLILTVECDDGYDMNTQARVTCTNGNWQSGVRPQCIKRCGTPPFMRNAEVRMEGQKDEVGRYKKTSTATYSCASGFRLIPANSYIRICMNGMWSGVAGSCVAYGCPLPMEIENGYFVLETMSNNQPDNSADGVKAFVNQRAHYNCNYGYVLSVPTGSATVTCIESGEWSPRIPPKCKKFQPDDTGVSCEPPQLAPYTITTTLQGHRTADNSAVVGTEIEVKCQDGYRDTRDTCPPRGLPKVLRCMGNVWEGSLPDCAPVDGCSSPANIANGAGFGISHRAWYPIATQIMYSCLPGYILYGSPVISCTPAGCWDPPVPECRPEIFVSSFISSSTLLISLVTAMGVMLILFGVCLVVVCRYRRKPYSHHRTTSSMRNTQRSRGTPMNPNSSGMERSVPANGGNAAMLHDPDRVALIACADGVLLGDSSLPSYEEAVRDRAGGAMMGAGGGLAPYRAHRPHWSTLVTGRRQRGPNNVPAEYGHHITRQSSSTSHSASLRSGSAGDSMGSTDTMAPSEVSTNVTLDTVSSHTCSSGSQTASCRATCGSLASFDTSSVLNTEGVPLLEESELEDSVLISSPSLGIDRQASDTGSFKYRRTSPDLV